MKIAILGAGDFGTALGGILAEKGYDIDYYDSTVEKERLCDVMKGTKYMILAVPSKAAPYLLPHLPKDIPMIVATKGFLDTHAFDSFRDYMVMSGPGFAKDIKAQKKTRLTATDHRISRLLATEYLNFDFTDDTLGVLMCGALKNVYAIYAGMLGLLRGFRGWDNYLTDVSGEMAALLKENGADPKTFGKMCGIGDLALTCDFPSRNYEFGLKVRENPKYQPEKTVEGVTALAKIKRGDIKVPESAILLRELMAKSDNFA